MKKNLVLIGMMGSGKSTISRLLSDITNQNVFDTDKLIEKETKLKINEIFQKKGEDFFRKIEEKIVLNSLKFSNNIIKNIYLSGHEIRVIGKSYREE